MSICNERLLDSAGCLYIRDLPVRELRGDGEEMERPMASALGGLLGPSGLGLVGLGVAALQSQFTREGPA